MGKNLGNVHRTTEIPRNNLDNSVKKNETQKIFLYLLRWTGFLIIPLTNLYDQNMGRSKLIEQTHLNI